MKKIPFILLAIFLFQVNGFSQRNYLDTIWNGGAMRTFRVYVPAIYNAKTPSPLVFSFHGTGGNAVDFERATKFRQVADTANFILITPNGAVEPLYPKFGQIWYNWACCNSIDDTDFISDLIDTLSTVYTLDLNRIYSAGYSNGGMMGYDLGCKLSHRIAAIASVGGSMVVSRFQACTQGKAVPIIEIHGTNDRAVAFTGGANVIGEVFEPIDSVMKLWSGYAKCYPLPRIVEMPNISTDDGSTITRYTWKNCKNGSSIELLKVNNGGHTWPGNAGMDTNRDIIAEVEIWRFFSRYKLN